MARKSKTSPSLDDVLRQAIADRGVPLTRIAEGSGVPLPVLSRYMAGFDESGRIQAYKADLYSNAGHTLDLSRAVLGKIQY